MLSHEKTLARLAPYESPLLNVSTEGYLNLHEIAKDELA
jgi:hypothetical protein